jgi:hypothetical protein
MDDGGGLRMLGMGRDAFGGLMRLSRGSCDLGAREIGSVCMIHDREKEDSLRYSRFELVKAVVVELGLVYEAGVTDPAEEGMTTVLH